MYVVVEMAFNVVMDDQEEVDDQVGEALTA